MKMTAVKWQKCSYNLFWCRFNPDLLNDPRLESRLETPFGILRTGIAGVYIIWTGIDNHTILKVGSGIIKSRFREHLSNPKVQEYRFQGLYATWAPIALSLKPSGRLDDEHRGVERFLGVRLNPKLTERLPNNVDPIWVNLPEWNPPVHPLLRGRNQSGHILSNRPSLQFRNR